ncbi:MAG: phosphatase PAP2 family protein [Candidatus Aminicenantes bacterium]|nr:phosphatase PAP2 family protein [Candidatus Aminicenantes bacterium]
MEMMILLLLLALVALLGERYARAREREGKSPGFFYSFWKHAAGNLRPVPLALLALSALLTWGLVASGWDRDLQVFFQRENPLGRTVPWVFLSAGTIWHMLLAVAITLRGRWRGSVSLMGGGLAGIQALLLNLLVNTTEKFLTGRRGPENLLDETFTSRAPFPKTKNPADFSFDFWNRGHGDGRFFWPSGHTSAIFAFVACLRTYYPEKRWIAWVGYPFALFTALAMVDGDFHWVSDVVAGAILGEILGGIVGRGFRRRFKDSR